MVSYRNRNPMLAYSLLSCVNIIIINILFGQLSIVNITDRQHPMLLDWLDRAGHMYEPEDRGAWGDQVNTC